MVTDQESSVLHQQCHPCTPVGKLPTASFVSLVASPSPYLSDVSWLEAPSYHQSPSLAASSSLSLSAIVSIAHVSGTCFLSKPPCLGSWVTFPEVSEI